MNKKNLSVMVIFFIAVIGLAYIFKFQLGRNQKILNIYIPCGMITPFKELSKVYESLHPFVKVKSTFDNTNILTRLIINKGSRPDIFISPGEKELSLLVEKGLIEESSIRRFGWYELILIVPRNSQGVNRLEDLTNPSVKTIALASPDFNSVGAYAIESLKTLGFWEKIKDKFLYTNAPIEALTFVATSKADATIHYDACPFETASNKISEKAVKIVAKIPLDTHSPIYNYIAILKDSQNKNLAYDFIGFMFSKKASKILAQYGLGDARAKQKVSSKEIPKVMVEAYYPFNEEHLFIKDYLLSLSSKYKGEMKIECIDFRSDYGYTRWRKSGLSCGGILINGKNKFNIEISGKTKEVEFIKTMDIFWTKEDLEAAIEKELSAKK